MKGTTSNINAKKVFRLQNLMLGGTLTVALSIETLINDCAFHGVACI